MHDLKLININNNKEEIFYFYTFVKESMDEFYKEIGLSFNVDEVIDALPGNIVHVMAKSDGETIGYLSYLNNIDCFYVRDIHIRSEFKNMGVGKKLMEHVINEATSSKVNRLRLRVFSKNKSLSFFEGIGFRSVGNETDKTRMELEIKS